VVGELVFRPRIPLAMASGYYKDPERTGERFRDGIFHTGDLGRVDEDGLLHFASRTTERIRRRGENIGAPEVESVALRHEAVVEAAAYAVPAELGDDEVKLDVVLRAPVEAAALHEWLARNLPRYMVPRYLEIRDGFPKTPSLRVEKYKLQAQPLDRPEVFVAADASSGAADAQL
jgi:crotonobetaine/carnitine-CoA ligase